MSGNALAASGEVCVTINRAAEKSVPRPFSTLDSGSNAPADPPITTRSRIVTLLAGECAPWFLFCVSPLHSPAKQMPLLHAVYSKRCSNAAGGNERGMPRFYFVDDPPV